MLLVIVISIIAMGAVIVTALYSSILPFFSILGNTANYNIAYYGAIASTERALLSLRYHQAGYEGRGGFNGGEVVSGVVSDLITQDFGNITQSNNKMQWSILSVNNGLIPEGSGGDVEPLLAGIGSKEFNMMGYDGIVEVPLYKDQSIDPEERYTTGTIATVTAPNGIYLEGTLRLPPKVLNSFSGAGIDTGSDIDNDSIRDDIIVNRGLHGINTINSETFSIIPTIAVDYNQEVPLYDFENSIRESQINHISDILGTNTPNFFMGDPSGDYEFNVILQPSIGASLLDEHNAVPANDLVVNSSSGFASILNDSTLGKPILSLNLLNRLSSNVNQVFPFLEWQIKVCENGAPSCEVPISDTYFHVDGIGKVGEYEVHIQLKKPVSKKDNTSDFAVIF